MTFIFSEEHLDTLEWAPTSSSIKCVVYQKLTKELFIEFLSKRRYRYSDVPLQLVEDFMRSQSAGRFFAQFIRDRFSSLILSDSPV